MDFLNSIPPGLAEFLIVLVFSLFIGLEQRRLHGEEKAIFGSDRTFTFIGIIGFILYILQPDTMYLFAGGGFGLIILLGIFYFTKVQLFKDFGLTSITIALITYCLAPLVFTQPKGLVILIVVSVLIFAELKQSLLEISTKFDKNEFITLAKFLVIAGVILPIVPDEPLFSFVNITPYRVWLAVVVVSTISYLSYVLQKFVFKESGIIVSGILGGLYSSTATTLILSRKSTQRTSSMHLYTAAILIASSMKYIRILIILFIFNADLAIYLLPYLIILFVLNLLISVYHIVIKGKEKESKFLFEEENNPLELKIAALFAVLYILFTFATHLSIQYLGITGLNILAFGVGFTQIDPFLINLFQGKYALGLDALAYATLFAILSNLILKSIYVWFFANKKIRIHTVIGFGIVLVANVIIVLIL